MAKGGNGNGNGGGGGGGRASNWEEEIFLPDGEDVNWGHTYGDDNSGNDKVTGGNGNDTIEGGDGVNILKGGDGNDTLIGGTGEDQLHGDAGTDTLIGGDGNDLLYFSAGSWIEGHLENGTYVEGYYEADTYYGGYGESNFGETGDTGDNDILLFGDALSVNVDFNSGTYTAMVLDPEGNPTSITGDFFGIETMSGSPGKDIVYGSDVLTHSFIATGGGNDEIYAGNANTRMNGGTGDDLLIGGSGDDWIDGGSGDDTLIGGLGSDTLKAGQGNDSVIGGSADEYGNPIISFDEYDNIVSDGVQDIFYFRRAFGDGTVILDFENGTDLIDLSEYAAKNQIEFSDLNIFENDDGDTVVEFWFNKQGGAGGSFVLQDVSMDAIDISDFIFIA